MTFDTIPIHVLHMYANQIFVIFTYLMEIPKKLLIES